jgi:two-component system NarL family sensor kinase
MPPEVALHRAPKREDQPVKTESGISIQPAVARTPAWCGGMLQIMERPDQEGFTSRQQPAHTPRYTRRRMDDRLVTQGRTKQRGTVVQLREVAQRRRTRGHSARMSELLHASLNTVSAQVLILDSAGNVMACNLAWHRFASENSLAASQASTTTSYLSVYEEWRTHCPQAQTLSTQVASVIAGQRTQARERYQWQGSTGARWFELKATRLDCGEEQFVVLVNEDITAAIEAEQALGEAAEHQLTVQERERQVIAQELHDSTAQHIVAAGLNLMGLRARLEQCPDVMECLERIEASLDEACKELRSFTYLLHPPCLEEEGLAATVKRYVEGFGARAGLQTIVRISRSVEDLPSVLERPLLRVIQEALGNVHRHASARRVTVSLRCIHGALHLIVRDDGRGIGRRGRYAGWKVMEPAGAGVGIPGIRARLRQFGGKLLIKSGAKGTLLHAAVPILSQAARLPADVHLGGFAQAFGSQPV